MEPAEFDARWRGFGAQPSGSFACGVSRVPPPGEVCGHLDARGFCAVRVAPDAGGGGFALHVFAQAAGDEGSTFLAEFRFSGRAGGPGRLSASFKCDAKRKTTAFVALFELQALFAVVA